jgi:hypothetical protein
MTTKKQRLSVRVVQGDGVIGIAASIPEEQLKNCGKLFWGLVGSGVVWVITHFPLLPVAQVASPKSLPPVPTQVEHPQSTAQ